MSDDIYEREYRYSNGEITVVWRPWLCEHSKHCWMELPEVFHPSVRPWITPKEAPTDVVVKQVHRCPSGALTIEENKQEP